MATREMTASTAAWETTISKVGLGMIPATGEREMITSMGTEGSITSAEELERIQSSAGGKMTRSAITMIACYMMRTRTWAAMIMGCIREDMINSEALESDRRSDARTMR